MEMIEFITLSIEKRKEIADMFGVKPQMVWLALRYGSHSKLAVKIRAEAIKAGGKKTFKYV